MGTGLEHVRDEGIVFQARFRLFQLFQASAQELLRIYEHFTEQILQGSRIAEIERVSPLPGARF